MRRGVAPVKRSVAIHPILDRVIEECRHMLSLDHRGVTYSTALNVLLLAAFMETQEKEKSDWGWSRETQEAIRDFLQDRASVSNVVNKDAMLNFRRNL